MKTINNANTFSQPSLIIFTKGADTFGNDCMYICIMYIYIHTHTHTHTQVHLNKLECRGKVHLFQ